MKPDLIIVHRPDLLIPPFRKQKFGLGDAVAIFAQPIAQVVDKVSGSSPEKGLVNCGSCAERRAALNAIIPDLQKFNPFK
jgi:hypothetical protein